MQLFNRKGQGSLEYILLIGGAILIAAIVITLAIGTVQNPDADPKEGVSSASNEIYCNQFNGDPATCKSNSMIQGKKPSEVCSYVGVSGTGVCHAKT